MFGKAVAKDDQRIAYVAPTFQQARDIAWEQLKKICQPIATNINASRLEITVKTQSGGTSLIILRGWEAVETLRGQRFDFIVIDEVAMMRNFWVGWKEVVRPTLTDSQGDALFISTPKGFNHFYDLYNLPATNDNYKSFHFTSYDNPHINPSELDAARGDSNFDQEYMADFRKAEGLVYKDFDRTRHIYIEAPTNISERIAGVDFGYTNPTCLLTIEKDFDAHYWISGEWYRRGKTNTEVIEYAKTLGLSTVFYPDPAEPDRIEEMKRAGLNCREVNKDIPTGIDTVRNLFRANRIHIHQSCENLIAELETYSYPDKRPDNNEQEKPIKENDHAVDALRYALFMNAPIDTREPANDNFNLYRSSYG